MYINDIFNGLPFGFSSFEAVKDSLIECRAIERLPKNAKTVISVLFPYYLGEESYKNSNISRYAVSADYHIITKGYMERFVSALKECCPENEFEYFIDNSPLPEVRCAVNAGLGFMGRNSLFISREYGSWVFLGEIVTDREFLPYAGEKPSCAGCGKCIEACPMGAISENGVNREKCLSFLNQKKGEISSEVKEKMIEHNCAWGCDVCQTVCPLNARAKTTPVKEFFETAVPFADANLFSDDRAFLWRGRAVIERNLKTLKGEEI